MEIEVVSWWLVVELDRKLVLCEAEVVVHNVAVRYGKGQGYCMARNACVFFPSGCLNGPGVAAAAAKRKA